MFLKFCKDFFVSNCFEIINFEGKKKGGPCFLRFFSFFCNAIIFRSSLASERLTIHKNLMLAMLLATVLFLLGVASNLELVKSFENCKQATHVQ